LSNVARDACDMPISWISKIFYNTCNMCYHDYYRGNFMTMTGKELVSQLKKNGWKIDRVQGSHHIMTKEGNLPVAVPVHGSKDIPKGTLNQLLKDTGLKGRY